MTDRDLINLIVEKSRADGRLMLNLSEDTIWSDHFGWGFGRADDNTFQTLNVRIKTNRHATENVRIKTSHHTTDDDVVHSVRLGWFDMRYARKEFEKLKNEIKQAKKKRLAEQENQEKDEDRSMLESFIKNLGGG
jgi:hypothetical protein